MALQTTCPRTREHGPSGNEYILYLARRLVYRYLRAYLRAGDEILVHQSIEDTPTLNRVTRQEQEVYVGQLPRYVFVQDTAYNGVKADSGVCLARYTSRYMHFVPSESLTQLLEPPISRLSEKRQRVGARSTNYARQVRHIHLIEVHCYDVSYSQPGQPLVGERAAATKTYDADLELGQNGSYESI